MLVIWWISMSFWHIQSFFALLNSKFWQCLFDCQFWFINVPFVRHKRLFQNFAFFSIDTSAREGSAKNSKLLIADSNMTIEISLVMKMSAVLKNNWYCGKGKIFNKEKEINGWRSKKIITNFNMETDIQLFFSQRCLQTKFVPS